MYDFQALLASNTNIVEAKIIHILSQLDRQIPSKLQQAMQYGCLNGGKRIRPFLILESCKLFNIDCKIAADVAVALEFIHCYSLIHDDLPSMDDDDYRRGQPTLHKKFDEATAILTGDALLTLAFEILASPELDLKPQVKLELIYEISKAAGAAGMVGGQILDLQEDRTSFKAEEITQLQAMKTGALLQFACISGAIIAQADTNSRNQLAEFGRQIGLAFQLKDDLLDIEADSKTLGKTAGKDIKQQKATLLSLNGTSKTKQTLQEVTKKAILSLKDFGNKANNLINCAEYIANRSH